jgi:hypothetical protein
VTASLDLPLRFSQAFPAASQATQATQAREQRVPLLRCKSCTAAVESGLRRLPRPL